MINVLRTLIAGSIVSACSASGHSDLPLTIEQIDGQNYVANVLVDRKGKSADGSYLREVYRQEIRLQFTANNLCGNGVYINRPTASGFDHGSYQLNYAVKCKSG